MIKKHYRKWYSLRQKMALRLSHFCSMNFGTFANNHCAVKQPTSEKSSLQTRASHLSSHWHKKAPHPDAHFEKNLRPAVSN